MVPSFFMSFILCHIPRHSHKLPSIWSSRRGQGMIMIINYNMNECDASFEWRIEMNLSHNDAKGHSHEILPH